MKHNPTKPLPIDDPVIAASIERALEPYKKIYTPAMLERARRDLQALLTAHPYTIALANAIRPRKGKAISTEDKIDSDPTAKSATEGEPARSSGKGSGRGGSQ